MSEMIAKIWIRNLLKLLTSKGSALDRYWKLEGLCKIEKTPHVIMQGAFAGPALASIPRQYCVRR